MIDDEIEYHEDFELWFPKYDHKPKECIQFVKDRLHQMDNAIDLCQHKRVVIQAGGHAGLWPKKLSEYFDSVFTFEPDPHLFRCMQKNLNHHVNITMISSALGDEQKIVGYEPRSSAGSGQIVPEDRGSINVMQTNIDKLGLIFCDAIFLDVEGHELEVLKGAETTINMYLPVIQIERNDSLKDCELFLSQFGYKFISEEGKDNVYKSEEGY